MYNLTTDKVETNERGYIDKNYILSSVSQEEIFEFVFGFPPMEFDYVTSPFRHDENPGCWFEYTFEGKLKFKDFGGNMIINGSRRINIDCFDAVKLYFNLPDLYSTLSFINEHLIAGKDITRSVLPKPVITTTSRKKVEIFVSTRQFNNKDKIFWSKFGITKQNLIDDKVFPVKSLKVTNTKKGDILSKPRKVSYAFTDFQEGRKKIYNPYTKGKGRFITNCVPNDIGGTRMLNPFGNQLVIKKSYKDWRVIKNQGLNSIWLQNERAMPQGDVLLPLCERFKRIIVFFDNDKQGIDGAKQLCGFINSHLENRAYPMFLPDYLYKAGITDPSDLVKAKGVSALTDFLNSRNVI